MKEMENLFVMPKALLLRPQEGSMLSKVLVQQTIVPELQNPFLR